MSKFFRGVSFLIFVTTLLVITSNAYSHYNREDWYELTHNYVCLNGEIAYSTTEWVVSKWNDNHPPNEWRWDIVCYVEYNIEEGRFEDKCVLVEVPIHQSHSIGYKVFEKYMTIRHSATPNNCRRFR
ncbi:MAG: hypothetical protein OXU23_13150 [Candidatus Poribacteria bacterium]|nr:hypothetical protein [Candidatus Poribacteria bacterium]